MYMESTLLTYTEFALQIKQLPKQGMEEVEEYEKTKIKSCLERALPSLDFVEHGSTQKDYNKKETQGNDKTRSATFDNQFPELRLNHIITDSVFSFKMGDFLKEEKPAEETRKRIKTHIEVLEILSKIFKGEDFYPEYDGLQSYQKMMITGVMTQLTNKIMRKYGNTVKRSHKGHIKLLKSSIENGEFIKIAGRILRSDIILVKRNEEKLKFIIKNTTKFLKKQFFNNNNLTPSRESELKFLNHYFKAHQEKYGLPIEAFSDPLNNTVIENPKFKTLSKTYFKMIFGVPRFKKIFFDFLDFSFKEYYQKAVLKKFKKMFRGLDSMLKKGSVIENEKIVENFIGGLESQRGCKIPWVDKEIDNAIFAFKKRVQRDLKRDVDLNAL